MNARLRYLLLAVLGVGLVAGTVLTLRSGDGDGSTDVQQQVVGHIGPTPGPDAVGHIEGRDAYLDELARLDPAAPAAALVSFSELLPAVRVEAMTEGLEVTALFVAFPGTDPEALTIRGTISRTVALRADDHLEVLGAEIDALEQRLEQDPDDEGAAEMLAERREALEQIFGACPCAYAVAVQRATVGDLVALRSRDGVRLVDVPEPLTDDLAGWELTPLLPPVAGDG